MLCKLGYFTFSLRVLQLNSLEIALQPIPGYSFLLLSAIMTCESIVYSRSHAACIKHFWCQRVLEYSLSYSTKYSTPKLHVSGSPTSNPRSRPDTDEVKDTEFGRNA